MSSDETSPGWVFTPRARRDLRRLDPPVQHRIIDALDRLAGNPPVGDVVRLTGVEGEWRLRVGDWRVRFTRDADGLIYILRVLPRGRAYRE
ncbi:MAG: type II toxin-antitoxin system RelE family toxin [Acidimicrobiales bacterium]